MFATPSMLCGNQIPFALSFHAKASQTHHVLQSASFVLRFQYRVLQNFVASVLHQIKILKFSILFMSSVNCDFFSLLTQFLYFSSGQCGWTNVIHTNLLQHLSTALQNRLFHFLSAPAANSFGNINQLPPCSVTLRTDSPRNGA